MSLANVIRISFLKLSFPYLLFSEGTSFNSMAKTGSLGDYLGLPTTFAGSYGDAGYRYTHEKARLIY